MNQRIAFIGAGNMAGALIGGLLADGLPPDKLIAADPNPAQRAALSETRGIETTASNEEAVSGADTVVLAVKPQTLKERSRSPCGVRSGHQAADYFDRCRHPLRARRRLVGRRPAGRSGDAQYAGAGPIRGNRDVCQRSGFV